MAGSGGRAPLSPFLRKNARDALRGTDAQAKKPVLVFDSVQKVYRDPSGNDRHVLRGVDLAIERGEFVFVTGASGAGKSTLLKLVYRAETVDEGRILFKADLGSVGVGAGQIQGVWVDPAYRGQGLAAPAMARAVELARTRPG